ncbi:MAG: methionine synthase [bacterium]|nr:methionine synthase [bacterium]
MEDVGAAVSHVLNRLPEIPFWPQFPRIGFYEQMVPQYCEGFPGIVEDTVTERVYVDAGRALSDLEGFYEKEMAGDIAAFGITPSHAVGLVPWMQELRRRRPSALACVKGHVTGPVTFGFTVKDETGAAIFYDPNFADVVIRLIAMKALFQINLFQEFQVPTIIFLDEPYMAAFGTTGMNISRDEVVGAVDRVVEKIREAGGIAGIHCCGNTDWSILFETQVDIVNFDAYDYMDKMSLYPEQISAFLDRGGNLAWGLIPTSPEAKEETAASLVKRFHSGVDRLVRLGVDQEKLLRQCLVTPACGMGSISEAAALRNLAVLQELSSLLRTQHAAP